MERCCDSTDRTTKEYFLFALACLGFFLGVYGVVLTSPALGLTGLFLFIFASWAVVRQPDP